LTQEEIIEMADKCGMLVTQQLEAFAKLVAAKEREACAKVFGLLADEALVVGDEDAVMCFEEAEDLIRARGEA
jgi:hypothetical protein